MSLSFKDCNQHNNPYCERLNYGGGGRRGVAVGSTVSGFWHLPIRIKVLRQYEYLSKIALVKLNMLYIVGYRHY